MASNGIPGGFQLGAANVPHAVDDLALQVAQLHGVVIDDAQRAHTRRSQIQQGRGAQAAGTNDQHTGVAQPPLPLQADLGDEGVA